MPLRPKHYQMDFFPLDVFFAILITVGPLKVLLVYGEMTRDLAPELRRGIAIKAVGVAAIVGFGLQQADLPEVGSQSVVSEILNGKRDLNVRQIRALVKRFHVSPAVFI
jgi:hypothetical protein